MTSIHCFTRPPYGIKGLRVTVQPVMFLTNFCFTTTKPTNHAVSLVVCQQYYASRRTSKCSNVSLPPTLFKRWKFFKVLGSRVPGRVLWSCLLLPAGGVEDSVICYNNLDITPTAFCLLSGPGENPDLTQRLMTRLIK